MIGERGPGGEGGMSTDCNGDRAIGVYLSIAHSIKYFTLEHAYFFACNKGQEQHQLSRAWNRSLRLLSTYPASNDHSKNCGKRRGNRQVDATLKKVVC